jgi:hypothetical protein
VIGLICFALGLVLMSMAQLLNVQFNYDGESPVMIILWSFVIIVAFCLLFLFVSVTVFGGMIL